MLTDWWARLRARPARRPKVAPCVLRLELLEDRTLPATIHWAAGSGDFNVGSNWSGGVVPGPNDVAVIDTGSTAATITIQPGANIQVQAVNTGSADTLSFSFVPGSNPSSLTVTAGASTLNGPLDFVAGGSLTGTGSSVSLTANGPTRLQGYINLYATSGAQMSFPRATVNSPIDGTLQAAETGSTLTFGALTSIGTGRLTIKAVQGGQVQLPALTTIGQTSLSADGTGSTINVSALTSYNLGGTFSAALSVTNGGTVLDGALTKLDNVILNLDGTGSLAVSQWTAFTNGSATITGGTETFTNLANISSTFDVSGGAQVSLPAVTGYTASPYRRLQASGSGSTLALSALTSITGQTDSRGLDITATTGGQVQLPALTTIQGIVGLNVTSGGTILAGALTTLDSVLLTLDGTSTLAVSQWTAFTNSSATISGGTETFIKLANIDGSEFLVSGGAQVSLPAVTSYTLGLPSLGSRSLKASGFGSTLTLSALTSITSQPIAGVLFITAAQGGRLQLPALTTIDMRNSMSNGRDGDSAVQFYADGTGSTINAASLTTFIGSNINFIYARPSSIAVTNGGTLVVGALTNLAITGAPRLAVSGGITLDGTGAFSATGPINLNSVPLFFNRTAATPTHTFAIVNAAGGVMGTFKGLPEGAVVTASDGAQFTISYQANGGKTVMLTQLPSRIIVTGADAGGGPDVNVFDAATGQFKFGFFAYDQNFTGGVRVAVGDVNGDGVPDIVTAPGPGGGPDIHVYDSRNGALLRQFFAYDMNFTGGVYVVAGDVNRDGFADIICGADAGGGPNVSVFSGKDGFVRLLSFFPYDPAFTGGVRVAAGDTNGDGQAEVITGAGPGGGPNLTVYQFNNGQAQMLQSYFAYDQNFSAGVYVAAGDINGDGRADVVVGAGAGGGPNVAVFNGIDGTLLSSFFAFDPLFTGGVRVAAVHRTGTGPANVIAVPGPGGGPQVRTLDGLNGALLDSFFAYDPQFTGGVYVAGSASTFADPFLDPSFGTAGVVGTEITPAASALLSNGEIVTVGSKEGSNIYALERFNADGSVASSFDIRLLRRVDQASLAAQSDGKFVFAVSRSFYRFSPDGTLDPFPSVFLPTIFAVAVQGDGKLVVAGTDTGPSFAVARLNADLTPDNSFGSGGKVFTHVPGAPLAIFSAVAIQGDGKIVAAGIVGRFDDMALMRYNPDGTFDTSFNGTGQVFAPFGPANQPFTDGNVTGLVIQPDGKIVVAANYSLTGTGSPLGSTLTRYLPTGALDSTFGDSGQARLLTLAGVGGFGGFVLRPGGDFLAAAVGDAISQGSGQVVHFQEIDRVDANGRVLAQTPINLRGNRGNVVGMLLQPDSKIILFGVDEDGSGGYLARLQFVDMGT